MSLNEPIYVKKINEYLDNDLVDAFYLRRLGNISYVQYLLKRYIIRCPEKETEINKILDNLENLYFGKLSHEHLKTIMELEMDNKIINYSNIFYELLFSDPSLIESIINKYEITENKFNGYMKKFIKKYPHQDEEVLYLNDIYNKYISTEVIANSMKLECLYVKNDLNDQELRVIDIFKSELSIIEYCSYTGMTYKVAKFAIDKCLKSSNEYFKNISNEILKRDNTHILNELKDLSMYIATHNNFDILDYYENTKLSIQDYREIITQLVPKNIVVKNMERLRKLKFLDNNISVQIELEAKTIIGGREVTREEKEKVFNYIDEKKYPIGLYPTVLRKYANNELDLDKVLVKK